MEKVSYSYRAALRQGLLQSLAENGITPSDIYNKYMDKVAGDGIMSVIDVGGTVGGIAKGLGTLLVDYPVATAIAGGSAAGLGAGWGIGKMMQLPDGDPIEDLKNQELIKELRYQTMNQKLKQRRNPVNGF